MIHLKLPDNNSFLVLTFQETCDQNEGCGFSNRLFQACVFVEPMRFFGTKKTLFSNPVDV